MKQDKQIDCLYTSFFDLDGGNAINRLDRRLDKKYNKIDKTDSLYLMVLFRQQFLEYKNRKRGYNG